MDEKIQDKFLSACRQQKVPVNIFLVSGVRLQGTIGSFDQYSILISGGGGRSANTQNLVLKSAISTISPTDQVDLGPKGKRDAPASRDEE